jgi:hypothetical protein
LQAGLYRAILSLIEPRSPATESDVPSSAGSLPAKSRYRVPHMRRVVVTGMGMATPLACGAEPTWQRLITG